MKEKGKVAVAAEQADAKPNVPATGAVTIVVKAQNNAELAFKVKMSTPFSKISNAYCKNQGVDPKSVRFHDGGGGRIALDQTIAELDLDIDDDDGDGPKGYVEAYLEQTGGVGNFGTGCAGFW